MIEYLLTAWNDPHTYVLGRLLQLAVAIGAPLITIGLLILAGRLLPD